MSGNTFTVTGGYGSLLVCASTGDTLKRTPATCYLDVDRFDVEEWRVFYGEDIEGRSIDVLDIGSWDKGGMYEPPEMDWRLTALIKHTEGGYLPEARRFASFEVAAWIDDGDSTDLVTEAPLPEGTGFGVYGRFRVAEGALPYLRHLFDAPTYKAALELATYYARGRPIDDLVPKPA